MWGGGCGYQTVDLTSYYLLHMEQTMLHSHISKVLINIQKMSNESAQVLSFL